MEENTSKGKLFDNNLGIWHNCTKRPVGGSGDPKEEYWKKQKQIDEWMEKFFKYYRYMIPVWCSFCRMGYKPNSVCGHILSEGYKEGVHGCDFFSDSYKWKEYRVAYKLHQEKLKDPQQFVI